MRSVIVALPVAVLLVPCVADAQTPDDGRGDAGSTSAERSISDVGASPEHIFDVWAPWSVRGATLLLGGRYQTLGTERGPSAFAVAAFALDAGAIALSAAMALGGGVTDARREPDAEANASLIGRVLPALGIGAIARARFELEDQDVPADVGRSYDALAGACIETQLTPQVSLRAVAGAELPRGLAGAGESAMTTASFRF